MGPILEVLLVYLMLCFVKSESNFSSHIWLRFYLLLANTPLSKLPPGQVSLGRDSTQRDHSAGRLWVVTGLKTFLDVGQNGLRGT